MTGCGGTPDYAAELMKPYGGAMEAWEIGAEVGNVRTTGRSYWSGSGTTS
jgi:hypothetical protein